MAFCVCWYTTTFPGRRRPQFEEDAWQRIILIVAFRMQLLYPQISMYIYYSTPRYEICVALGQSSEERYVGGFRWACSTPHPNITNDLLLPTCCLDPKQNYRPSFHECACFQEEML